MSLIRNIRWGEALAIDPAAIRQGREALFFLWGTTIPPNARVGAQKDIAVVYVHEPMDHHKGEGGDSYDALKTRVAQALKGEDCDAEETGAPKAVILCIDSPGGVVSGLNECALSLRKMCADAGIPLYAYVNEMAASAAYAIACAADEVYLPPSAIAGSVGVISTMVDQTKADEAMGLRFVTLTSGARKSDGHPHVAITDAAITAEQGRIDKLAMQFYRLVQQARGLSPKVIQSYQAGIFLGAEAVDAGLADGVMSWDEMVASLDDEAAEPLAETTTGAGTKSKGPSMLKLKNLIAKTKASIATEKDAKKLAALKANLASFEATLKAIDAKSKHVIEHKEVHTDDGAGPKKDDDDGGGDDDAPPDSEEEEEEEEEEAAAEGNETDRGDDPEDDEDEDDEEEEEEAKKAAKKAKALLAKVTDPAARGALTALVARAAKTEAMAGRLAAMEKDTRARAKTALIDEALAQRRITPVEAKQLRAKKASFVKGFLEMRPKAVVHTTQEDLAVPKGGRGGPSDGDGGMLGASDGAGGAYGLSAETMEWIEKAHAATDQKIPIEKFVANYKADLAKQNGAGRAGGY